MSLGRLGRIKYWVYPTQLQMTVAEVAVPSVVLRPRVANIFAITGMRVHKLKGCRACSIRYLRWQDETNATSNRWYVIGKDAAPSKISASQFIRTGDGDYGFPRSPLAPRVCGDARGAAKAKAAELLVESMAKWLSTVVKDNFGKFVKASPTIFYESLPRYPMFHHGNSRVFIHVSKPKAAHGYFVIHKPLFCSLKYAFPQECAIVLSTRPDRRSIFRSSDLSFEAVTEKRQGERPKE